MVWKASCRWENLSPRIWAQKKPPRLFFFWFQYQWQTSWWRKSVACAPRSTRGTATSANATGFHLTASPGEWRTSAACCKTPPSWLSRVNEKCPLSQKQRANQKVRSGSWIILVGIYTSTRYHIFFFFFFGNIKKIWNLNSREPSWNPALGAWWVLFQTIVQYHCGSPEMLSEWSETIGTERKGKGIDSASLQLVFWRSNDNNQPKKEENPQLERTKLIKITFKAWNDWYVMNVDRDKENDTFPWFLFIDPWLA